MTDWTNRLRDTAEKARREAEAIEGVARVPAFAALPVKAAFVSGKAVHLACELPTRQAVAETFATLCGKVEPLPLIAYKGTFAGFKPACDYTARDGDITLDADSALPCYFQVQAYREGAGTETLLSWFETATDRVSVRFDVAQPVARVTAETVRDHRNRIVGRHWYWTGLPNASHIIRYAGTTDAPGQFAFGFDHSTDLAAWLDGRRDENRSA